MKLRQPPNHTPQRTRPQRYGCNPRPSWARSLSLGRSVVYSTNPCLFRNDSETDPFRNGWPASMGGSKLVDGVAFWHRFSVPETQLRGRRDTRRPLWPPECPGKRRFSRIATSDLNGSSNTLSNKPFCPVLSGRLFVARLPDPVSPQVFFSAALAKVKS